MALFGYHYGGSPRGPEKKHRCWATSKGPQRTHGGKVRR